jgi:serine protease Do
MSVHLRICLTLVVLVGALSFQAHGEPFPAERILPVPLAEAREAVFSWLKNNGFDSLQSEGGSSSDHSIHVRAQKNESAWTILLQPHSALATRVEVMSHGNEPGFEAEALWAYLDAYLNSARSVNGRRSAAETPRLPPSINNLRKAAVCIRAPHNGTTLRLSGFAVAHQGLIAATAHDLKLGQTVSIELYNGMQLNGRVVRLDADRDLCLIQVPELLEAVVPLGERRHSGSLNDVLFALGCSDSDTLNIHTGFIDGPPRRVAGQLLWQVQMQIKPGSSGSPVFDEMGRLVAVVKGRYRGAHHIGFLIPYETLQEFLETNLK